MSAATNAVLGHIGVRLPIMGAKGYSVDVVGDGTPPQHAMYLMETKLGLSPLREGVRIAGAFELPGKGSEPNNRRLNQLIEQTRPYVEGWEPNGFELTSGRAGLRPATPDSLPFVGPIPGKEGIYVAAGHGMLGVTLAPATASAMSSMIVDKVIPEAVLPLQLSGRI